VVTASLADRPWRSLRWLVLAPHADDETLGAGALIAQAEATGHFAGRIQPVIATPASYCGPRNWSRTSAGVFHPSVFRGRVFMA
jgi:hypothetical protein